MNNLHAPTLSPAELEQWREEGYLRLGHVVPAEDIDALCQRIDMIMLGEIR